MPAVPFWREHLGDADKEVPVSQLNIAQVKLQLGHKTILEDISMDIPLGGRLIGLLGPNGAGKSTLFKCITGFERAYSGTISLNGQALNGLSPSQRTQKGLGYLPQESWLFQDMTVRENLNMFSQLLGRRHAKAIIEAAMAEMGLEALAERKAKVLSGGEKRRLEFARTLLLEPQLMLLDEPFTGIDPKTIQEILRIIHGLVGKGISVMISDHHAHQILQCAEWIYVMAAGVIIEAGTAETIQANPQVRKIYLGDGPV
jgi:lipopolysaccharide export system ATP-binding protein